MSTRALPCPRSTRVVGWDRGLFEQSEAMVAGCQLGRPGSTSSSHGQSWVPSRRSTLSLCPAAAARTLSCAAGQDGDGSFCPHSLGARACPSCRCQPLGRFRLAGRRFRAQGCKCALLCCAWQGWILTRQLLCSSRPVLGPVPCAGGSGREGPGQCWHSRHPPAPEPSLVCQV